MMRAIIVALDGSPSSNVAGSVALRLAARHKARLHALGILDTDFIQRPQPVPAGAMSYKRSLDLSLLKEAGQRLEAVLDVFASKARAAEVQFKANKVEGAPRAAIEKAATASDLIVVGKTSLYSPDGEISSLPLCVEQMLRNSVRPILVVPDLQVVGEPGRELAPIVVGFDGSVVSSRAIHLFALLGLGRGRQVHVISQNDGSTAYADLTAEHACSLLRAHGLKRVRAVGLGDQEAGKPAETILGTAKSSDASMIVMGAYGHRGVQEIFGSCTRSVLSGLRTPLFMYH